MKKYQPSRAALNSFRIILLIVAGALVFADFWFLQRLNIPIIMYALASIFVCLYFFVCFIYLPLYFKNGVYYVSPTELTKNSGVFIKSRQVMRLSAIQYLTEVKMPLSSLTSSNFIIVNAFGGKMGLMFLSLKDCEEITSLVSQAIRNRTK